LANEKAVARKLKKSEEFVKLLVSQAECAESVVDEDFQELIIQETADDVIRMNSAMDRNFVEAVSDHIMVVVFEEIKFSEKVISYICGKKVLSQFVQNNEAVTNVVVDNWRNVLNEIKEKIMKKIRHQKKLRFADINERYTEDARLHMDSFVEPPYEDKMLVEGADVQTSVADLVEEHVLLIVQMRTKHEDEFINHRKPKLDLQLSQIDAFVTNFQREVNTIIHSILRKIACIWAEMNNCFDSLPNKIKRNYVKRAMKELSGLCLFSGVVDGETTHSVDIIFAELIANKNNHQSIAANQDEMETLVKLLYVSTETRHSLPAVGSIEEAEKLKKYEVMIKNEQNSNISNATIISSPSSTMSNDTRALVGNITSTCEQQALVSNNLPLNASSSSSLSFTPSSAAHQLSAPTGLLHTKLMSFVTLMDTITHGVVVSDEIMRLNMETIINSQTRRSVDEITTMLKFLEFLHCNQSEKLEAVTTFFMESALFQKIKCDLFIRVNEDDHNNIIGDGNCYPRTEFQGRRRAKDYTLTVAQMKRSDEGWCDSSKALNAMNELLESVQTITDADEKYDATVRIEMEMFAFQYFNKQTVTKCCYGRSEWSRYLRFNLSGFSQETGEGDLAIWSRFTCSSQCPDHNPGAKVTLSNCMKVTNLPNYYSFKSAHFFVVTSPDSMTSQLSFKTLIQQALGEMIARIKLVDDRHFVQNLTCAIEMLLSGDRESNSLQGFNNAQFNAVLHSNFPMVNFDKTQTYDGNKIDLTGCVDEPPTTADQKLIKALCAKVI
jgi:hypothetical protein